MNVPRASSRTTPCSRGPRFERQLSASRLPPSRAHQGREADLPAEPARLEPRGTMGRGSRGAESGRSRAAVSIGRDGRERRRLPASRDSGDVSCCAVGFDLDRHAARRPPARVRLRRGRDSEHRPAGAGGRRLRGRLQPLPAHAPRARLDADRPPARPPRRAGQHRLPPGRRPRDAGDPLPCGGAAHGGGGLRLRAALDDRDRPGIRALRRRDRGASGNGVDRLAAA
jgi:hypothetical protein